MISELFVDSSILIIWYIATIGKILRIVPMQTKKIPAIKPPFFVSL